MSLSVRAGLLISAMLIPLSSAAAQNMKSGFHAPQAFGAGGGAYISMVKIEVPDLNSRLAAMGLDPFPDWISLQGGGGGVNIGSVWIGGFSSGGTIKMSATSGGILREARIDISQGGFTLGYLKAFGRMKLTIGGTVGMGHMDIRLIRRPQATGTWDDVWEYYATGFAGPVDASSLTTSSTIEGKYFLFEPYLSLRWWFMPMFAIDMGATYQLATIGGGRLRENGQSISGSPELDLSGMGVRIGLYIGF